jgi:hypothetical protein
VVPPSRGPGRSSSHGERGPGRDVIDGAADEDCLGGPGRERSNPVGRGCELAVAVAIYFEIEAAFEAERAGDG